MTELSQRIANLSPEKRELLMRRLHKQQESQIQITPVPRDTNTFPLSFAQQRLWFLDQLKPNSSFYNIPAVVRLKGKLNVAALEWSFNEIIRRHEALRTTFVIQDEQPVQVIHPATTTVFKLSVLDLQEFSQPEQETAVEQIVNEEAQRPFDLSQCSLVRATLLKSSDEEHLLLLTMHHIVADGWSMAVFIREMTALYAASTSNKPSFLTELPIQYVDFAEWQRQWLQGEVQHKQLAYWKQQLDKAPHVLDLPSDRPRSPMQTFQGARHLFMLSSQLSESLKALSQQEGVTLFMTLLAAFNTLLYRYTGQEDILVGSPIANRNRGGTEGLIGFFANTLVLRTQLQGNPSFRLLLARVREVALGAYAHQDLPFEKLVEELQPVRDFSRNPMFQVMFALQNNPTPALALGDLSLSLVEVDTGIAKFDLTLTLEETANGITGSFEYNTDLFDAATIQRMAGHFQTLLESVVANPEQRLAQLPLLTTTEEHQLLVDWNNTLVDYPRDICIHQLFAAQVEKTPDAITVVFENEQLTYRELNQRANCLAHHLQKLGVKSNVLVGIYMERSLLMMVAILAILKAGGAYLPLDPVYPHERLTFMLADAQVPVLLTQQRLLEKLPSSSASVVCLDTDWQIIQAVSQQNPENISSPDDLAYTIYTSGSTGKPKGVMVTHRNVVNFFTGMDTTIGDEQPGTWLAATSISFDISVLELLWTLTRGFQVVINNESVRATVTTETPKEIINKEMAFSLFYFASDEVQAGADKYHLLLEGAKFADKHGFSAIWTPERHFHKFGGLYPNPSVVSAAIATITERIQIRAGSIVLPLQNPIRVAEEWSVVDNLSQGRVGISFASGWHVDDFVLAPQNYTDRFPIMFRDIATVRKLWRGESITLPGGSGKAVEVKIHPQPIQSELPIWVTAAGSPETFRKAGEIGANLLTHLLGQNLEELEKKIAIYRQSWQEHGHEGAGHVTLMIHTFVSEDINLVREKVRQPFCQYLKTSLGLVKNLVKSLGKDIDVENLSAQEEEELLNYAFNRYFETSSLFGTPSTCLQMINRLKAIGVDEVGCLIDFGVDSESVLSSLYHLNIVRELSNKKTNTDDTDYSLAAQIGTHNVTHLQCTPSLARMLIQDQKARSAMGSLRKVMLGGEALSISLAQQLLTQLSAEIYNMYGPTETTIWSATYPLQEVGNTIPIGRPIANTEIYILDRHLQLLPVGIPGELYIGGVGVTKGYLNRPELTAEKFIPNPFSHDPQSRLYKTGDLARYLPDGNIEYICRIDNQVKIRGFRIELGEIEALLSQYPHVQEVAVIVREDTLDDKRLVAYLVSDSEPKPSNNDLRQFLKGKLPEYMVPGTLVYLDTLPLTPNGKLDRRALPAPEVAQQLTASFVAPRTPIEEMLANIWADLLGIEKVGVHDNFFEIGGHSLLATQLVSRVRHAFKVEIALRNLFESATVAELSQFIQRQQQEGIELTTAPLQIVDRSGKLPLSFAQQRLWFLNQLEPDSTAYNIPAAIRIEGKLQPTILEQSISEIFRRHEALRTNFIKQDGEAIQVIHPAFDWRMTTIDLQSLPASEQEREIQRLATAEAAKPFDLATDQLIRGSLLALSENEHILLITIHHIVSDGWSKGLFIQEIAALYSAFVQGQPSPLPELPIQYVDFAVWQRQWLQGEELQKQLSYWQKQLAGAPSVLELPSDRPRSAVQTFRGASQPLQLSKTLTEDIKTLSRQEGVTVFVTLFATFTTLLYYYTGQEDIVLGTDVANRNRTEIEKLIGFFVNQLVLRADLSGNPTFRELLGRIREVALGAYTHQDLPFEMLVGAMKSERDPSRSPLFQIKFVLQNTPISDMELSDLNLNLIEVKSETAKFDVLLHMEEVNTGLFGSLQYNTDLFESATMARLLEHYQTLLNQIVIEPDIKLSSIKEILFEADKQGQLIKEKELQDVTVQKLKEFQRRSSLSY